MIGTWYDPFVFLETIYDVTEAPTTCKNAYSIGDCDLFIYVHVQNHDSSKTFRGFYGKPNGAYRAFDFGREYDSVLPYYARIWQSHDNASGYAKILF